MEHELPKFYIQELEKLKDNGERGCFKLYALLLRYVSEDPCVCDVPEKKEKPPFWLSEALRKKIEASKNKSKH